MTNDEMKKFTRARSRLNSSLVLFAGAESVGDKVAAEGHRRNAVEWAELLLETLDELGERDGL